MSTARVTVQLPDGTEVGAGTVVEQLVPPRRKPVMTFRCDDEFLAHPERYAISPDLPLGATDRELSRFEEVFAHPRLNRAARLVVTTPRVHVPIRQWDRLGRFAPRWHSPPELEQKRSLSGRVAAVRETRVPERPILNIASEFGARHLRLATYFSIASWRTLSAVMIPL